MPATDVLVARLQAEADDRTAFIDQLAAEAQQAERDLTSQEMQMIARAQARVTELDAQITPLRTASEVAAASRRRHSDLAAAASVSSTQAADDPRTLYRSAGAYGIDAWRSALGDESARERLAAFRRAAAHQTTADNLGVIPEPVLGPVINFIDAARPMVSFLGPRPIPGGPQFTRPVVTQHTQVAAQTGEKVELASRKMLISDLTANVRTYGGYVNVSRQNIDWSQPQILDIVVNDLAGQYAIQTESVLATDLVAAATAGPEIPADATAADIAGALWAAAGTAFAAVAGQGRLALLVSPDMLGVVGPLFAPISPQNAQSTGFSAGAYGTGVMGAVSGISVIMSPALPTGTMLAVSSAAVEVYEQRIGTLSVTEPSVLGVQVAYAGYFTDLVIEADAIIEITRAAVVP